MVRRKYQLNGQDSILYDGELAEVYAIQNASHSLIYGASFSGSWKFHQRFKLSSTLNYQKGEEQLANGSGSPSRHAAPFFMHNALYFNHEVLSLKFYHVFNAKVSNKDMNAEEQQKAGNYARDASGNAYTPAFHTFNLTGLYLINEQLLLSFGVENLLDVRYRTYSSGINAPGRNFILAAKVTF